MGRGAARCAKRLSYIVHGHMPSSPLLPLYSSSPPCMAFFCCCFIAIYHTFLCELRPMFACDPCLLSGTLLVLYYECVGRILGVAFLAHRFITLSQNPCTLLCTAQRPLCTQEREHLHFYHIVHFYDSFGHRCCLSRLYQTHWDRPL